MSKKRKIPTALVQYIVGICRKSQDREDRQIYSLDDQEKLIREHYNKLPEDIQRLYPLKIIKTARSAFKPHQPYLMDLCDMADRGEVYAVFAVFENRISRNHEDTGRFVQRLSDGRISYFEIVSGKRYTGADSSAIFMLCLEGAMSWKDSKDKGTIVLQRMELRAKEGKHMGRKSFGFKPNTHFTPDGKEVRETLVDEERLPNAIEMFRMMATNSYSLSDLEAWAEKRGIRARPAKNNLTGKISRTTIASILHDPYYKGEVWFNGTFQGKWTETPPVKEELWNRVQLVLLNRCNNTARVKKSSLRRLFIYGSAMRCGKCKGTLSPYKVVKKNGTMYIYYECKSRSRCGESIAQASLSKQYKNTLEGIDLPKTELERIRGLLLRLHEEKSQERAASREHLNTDYEKVERDIKEQVKMLPKAYELGVGKEADANIESLRIRREQLQTQLNATHEEGSAWIEKTIRSFELLKMAEEMLEHGSPHIREATLKAIASNYPVTDGKLVPELRSPFKEAFSRDSHSEWWTILGSNQ